MSALSKYLPSPPPAPPLVLARGDAFFTRRVPLAPGEPVAPQIALALEGMAPFPPEQLYYGYVPAADGLSALIFAAFRRRFQAEETESWDGAAMVTPEFVALLVAKPEGDGVTLHSGETRVIALGWKGGGDLPVSVVVRGGGPETAESAATEARTRADLPDYADVRRLEGEITLRGAGEGTHEAWVGEMALGTLPSSWAAGADIRDPEFLAGKRRAEVRDLWLWRGLLGAAAILVLSFGLELGTGVVGMLGRNREARIASQAPVVADIEAARSLATRIAERSQKRLMAFEMLALINPARPDSVIFQIVKANGSSAHSLEVEAQAANAEEVSAYTTALKALPALASVQTRGFSTKNNVTRVTLSLEFKPDALRNGGAL